MSRVIVAISGGKASAWCAGWALEKYDKNNVILYFNDVKWEDQDLYRFLEDLSKALNHPITEDSDGRSPEQLFYDQKCLANNRLPFCSRILKAERLHKFFQEGDTLVFGIGCDEIHRAQRLVHMYQKIADKRGINAPKMEFPLIKNKVKKADIDAWLYNLGIEEPLLYKLGFEHNNCSGGCVRAGKWQWVQLYHIRPEVYAERERVEREWQQTTGKQNTILKDISLTDLREKIINNELSNYYADVKPKDTHECLGICDSME